MGAKVASDIGSVLSGALLEIHRELTEMEQFAFIQSMPVSQCNLVIMDMSAKWALYRSNWRNPAEFILNYTERVYEATAPFVHEPEIEGETPGMRHVQQTGMKQLQWDAWSHMLLKFACEPEPWETDF